MSRDRRAIIRALVQEWFEEPVFFGFDDIPSLKKRIQNKEPYIFVDHAYFDRGYKAGNFRVIRNGIHQTTLKPCTREKTYFHGWEDQRKGRGHILMFPPSETMQETFDAQDWVRDTAAQIRKYTKRPIVVKHKLSEQPLKWFLKDAHVAIGFGTVAAVEAAVFGVPIIAGPHCPATPIACPMEDIEKPWIGPVLPWLNSLTWSQFSVAEIKSGLMKDVIENGP